MRALLLVALVGCGTTTFIPAGDGGSSGDGATDGAASDAPGDANDPCAAMKLQIDVQKKMLQMCTNPGSGGECQNVISDGCCPFSTSSDNTSSFESLVMQWKNKCMPLCLGACMNPQKVCAPDLTCR